MKFILLVLLVSLNLNVNVQANSSKYRGGELKLKKTNNDICFYIDNNELIGDYELNIFDKNKFNKLVNYTSSFNKNYPLENNCIKINYKFKNNIIYTAVLDSELTNFGRNFCLIDNEIGDFDGITCTEIKLSVWDKILIFFKNIIN